MNLLVFLSILSPPGFLFKFSDQNYVFQISPEHGVSDSPNPFFSLFLILSVKLNTVSSFSCNILQHVLRSLSYIYLQLTRE